MCNIPCSPAHSSDTLFASDMQVNHKILDEFWHSELASDPDNQNKEKVCVYVGLDEKGNRLYDLHERRVRTGDIKTLHRIFQRSEFGARFREACLRQHLNPHTRTPPRFPVGPMGSTPRWFSWPALWVGRRPVEPGPAGALPLAHLPLILLAHALPRTLPRALPHF